MRPEGPPSASNQKAIIRKSCCKGLNETDATCLVAFASRLVMLYISEFDRRIWEPCQTLPLAVLKFAKSAPEVKCEVRFTLACHIMDTESHDLEITGRKIKNNFQKDLALIITTGGCMARGRLYLSIEGVKRMWKVDVRKNEEMNKGLKLFDERVPNGGDPLRSARAGMKHYL